MRVAELLDLVVWLLSSSNYNLFSKFKAFGDFSESLFMVRPVWAQSNRWKSVTRPGSGKCVAKSKGVHREVESEESFRQSSGLTNRNHIRLQLGIRLPYKLKSNNYSELIVVNVADRWSERLRSYLGRSRQRMKLHQQKQRKSVVTTNGEKSAEVIVPSWLQTWWEGLNFRRCE